ncbi:MAG: hypothetical protein OXC28_05855 [Defluviicoccus sp.]|nr:hypothetical protein [Defluviicoccus sp.]
MDRRSFLCATGSAAALGLSGRPGLARTLPDSGALHRLLEETPRERVAAALAGLIRDGLDRRGTLAALAVATSRRVRPFPHVGFKYHTVLALQSVHLTALNLRGKERWLPVFWALDYFKRAQEAERRQSGWTMGAPPAPAAGTAEAAQKNLIDALDRWDLEAVDPAILDFARLAAPERLSEILFRYGIRDLRAIGHKAIAVQNVHRLLPLVGPEYAPPVLRSLAAALQNHGYGPNPATGDLAPDRTWRAFQAMLREIPKSWRQGRRDDAARDELVRTLREVSELDAGRAAIDLLRHGVAADSIWEAIFATAAELVLARPRVVPVHAQTSANAFHYVFRHARADSTRQLALLQSAAFMPAFRRGVGDTRADLRIEALEPLAASGEGAAALRDAFSELPHDPAAAARKALHYLQRGGSADRLVAAARRHLARSGRYSHDYKFTEAALENYREMAPGAWRDRILSASMAYFTGSATAPSPVAREALRLLG